MAAKARDYIARFREQTIGDGSFAATDLGVIDHRNKARLDEAVAFAEARPQWGRAQRALAAAARRESDSPAASDLQEIRTIRALRPIAAWPSNAAAQLALGQAYFNLDLGEEALSEFTLVQRLAPRRREGFVIAGLEYLYRGEYTQALSTWLRTRDLNVDLPPLDDALRELPARQ